MEILKLLIIFGLIVTVIWIKKSILIAVTVASAVTVLLYGLSVSETVTAVLKGAVGRATIEALLVFYAITYLQRMMEKRKNLTDSQTALNGIFHNRRINVSLTPFLLGCLPAASAVLICGSIVRDNIKDELSMSEKAAITTYFRHISEIFLPTYPTIFIAIGLTDGGVTIKSFLTAMLPMVFALFLIGYVIYLRRIPKETGFTSEKTKIEYLKLLGKSLWQILLAIFLILVIGIPVYAAVAVSIVLNIFVNYFTIVELRGFLYSAFERKLMLSTLLIMVFKEILAATNVISLMPELFSALPVPTFFVFALIFFMGSAIAGSQGITVLAMPLAVASIAGTPILPLFILLMCMNYVAAQLSPTHICLALCAEDYKVSFGSLIMKTLPMSMVFTGIAFIYYFILSMLIV